MRDKGLATAVATLLAAFAVAHLMQFGVSAGRAISGEERSLPIGIASLVATRTDRDPAEAPEGPANLPDSPEVSIGFPLLGTRDLPPDRATPGMLSVTRMNGFGLPCDRALRLDTAPSAILRARLYAPCDPVVRVEIRHAGLRFALETGEDGQIDVTLPAMMADAVVEAAFADGTVVRAGAAVPEVAGVDRIAIVSDGWAGLSLDANEAAVRYGGANGFLAVSGQTRDGAVHRLGESGIEAPVVAEVYTLPAGRLGMLGRVSFQIEVPVTSSNCARDIAAEVVRSQGGGQPVRGELRISVPSCEAEGDVLVVGLPAPDLRLARN